MARGWMQGLALTVMLAVAPACLAGFIKKKDGQIVQGSINGTIVLAAEEQSVTKGEKVSYLQVHILEKGGDVLSLDEDGAQLAPGSEIVIVSLSSLVSRKAESLSDLGTRLITAEMLSILASGPRTLVPKANDPDKGQWEMTVLKGVQEKKAKQQTAWKLLGELRSEKIIPSLEVVTAGGTVTIPVDDIVTFKSK